MVLYEFITAENAVKQGTDLNPHVILYISEQLSSFVLENWS